MHDLETIKRLNDEKVNQVTQVKPEYKIDHSISNGTHSMTIHEDGEVVIVNKSVTPNISVTLRKLPTFLITDLADVIFNRD